MSSQNDEGRCTLEDIVDSFQGNNQTLPYKNAQNPYVKHNSDSCLGSSQESPTDSSFRAKRLMEVRHPSAELKRRRTSNTIFGRDSIEEPDNRYDQLLSQRYANDEVSVSQESQRNSQLSVVEDEVKFEDDAPYDSDEVDLFSSQGEISSSYPETGLWAGNANVRSKRSRLDNGNPKTKEPRRSAPIPEKEISKIISANQRKKETNRRYAQDSRNRQKEKLKKLEQQTVQQGCIIEIYKKIINIFLKRLTKGAVPSWSPHEINWYPGNSEQQNCLKIKCFLPVLDDDFLEELGNAPYGKIVSNGTSKSQPEILSLWSDQKCQEMISYSKTHKDLSPTKMEIDVEKHQRPSASFNTTEHLKSESISEHFSQTPAPSSLEKSGIKLSSSVNMDANRSNINNDKCQIFSPLNALPKDIKKYIIFPQNTATVANFDHAHYKVAQQASTFKSRPINDDLCPSSATSESSFFPCSNPVCGKSQLFIGNGRDPACLSFKKINDFGMGTPVNTSPNILFVRNDMKSKIITNSPSESSFSLNSPARDAMLHVLFEKKEEIMAGRLLASSSASFQDTNGGDSDDLESLNPSIETV